MSSAELARLAAVTPQTMNALVHQLAQRDLLEQRPHPTHRKVIGLCLSPEGHALLDRATPAVRAVERAAFRDLPMSHTRIVTDWLATVIAEFTPDRTPR